MSARDPHPAPILQSQALSVVRDGREVLKSISLQVAPAEVVSIVGPSGSGKSSLLYALAGLIPCEGRVLRPERVGVVFQEHGVFPWLTVRGNIGFGIRSLPRAERDKIVNDLLKTCGLTEVASRYPLQLSGGQRQRVAVARTLARQTTLLLLDEPFASLDVVTRLGLHAWLRHLVDGLGVSIVFVTHDIEDAVRVSDRILVLAEGQIQLQTPGIRVDSGQGRGGRDVEALRQALVEAMTRSATSEPSDESGEEGEHEHVSVG